MKIDFLLRWSAFLLLLSLAAPAAEAAELDRVVVGTLPVTGHAKFFVGREEGFFAAEGLNVELVEFVTPHDGFAALRAEKLDVATFGTGLPLVHIANGADFMIIGGVAGGDVYLITSLEKKDSIKSLADLRGKKSLPCGSARGIWCSAGLSGRPGFPGKTTCGFSS